MSWGGYTDSRLNVLPGKTSSLALGSDTDETLYVASGQKILSASIRAVATSGDGSITDCALSVTRS